MKFLDELEKKARAATKGPRDSGTKGFSIDGYSYNVIPVGTRTEGIAQADLDFISTPNPATVLKMVTIIKEAKELCETYEIHGCIRDSEMFSVSKRIKELGK